MISTSRLPSPSSQRPGDMALSGAGGQGLWAGGRMAGWQPRGNPRARQSGAALVIALILLIVITLVGLAAIGSTLIQNRMAGNQYDREVAFQSAEAAVRAATALIDTNPGIIARDCQDGGVDCGPNPFTDPTLPAGAIHSVAAGSTPGTYTPGTNAAAPPQYVVEGLGNWVNYDSDTGYGQTANSRNYGAQGASATAVYYRITARSGDPSVVGNRAIVTLQVIVKQG